MARFSVFGAKGFIGRALTAHLRHAGHEVLALGRADVPPKKLGHVIYAIGLTADFRSRPFDTAHAHVGDLAKVMEQGGADSFLYLSSTRVYQGSECTYETTALRAEPLKPDHLYNLTKLAGEALVLNCGQDFARVARLSNILGPKENERDTFIGALVRDARQGTISLNSHPQSAKDYLWIDDAVQIIEMIALDGQQTIYNVASGTQTTHRHWVEAIAAMTGAQATFAEDAGYAGFPAIDTARIFGEFRHKPCDPGAKLAAILGLDL
jgi:nucleoside-diphosphate-sugar epimerase